MKDKPFALIGVHTNATEPEQLKEIMDKENLPWRSFVTGNTIKDKWNDPGTPMFYVIDHRGLIRYKWFGSPGAQAIDAAVEKLIEQALRK